VGLSAGDIRSVHRRCPQSLTALWSEPSLPQNIGVFGDGRAVSGVKVDQSSRPDLNAAKFDDCGESEDDSHRERLPVMEVNGGRRSRKTNPHSLSVRTLNACREVHWLLNRLTSENDGPWQMSPHGATPCSAHFIWPHGRKNGLSESAQPTQTSAAPVDPTILWRRLFRLRDRPNS